MFFQKYTNELLFNPRDDKRDETGNDLFLLGWVLLTFFQTLNFHFPKNFSVNF